MSKPKTKCKRRDTTHSNRSSCISPATTESSTQPSRTTSHSSSAARDADPLPAPKPAPDPREGGVDPTRPRPTAAAAAACSRRRLLLRATRLVTLELLSLRQTMKSTSR